ncbi:MAG: preprotein translocase subunit YajC [Gemmataceae bacterium]
MSMQEGQTAPESSRPADGPGTSQPMWWNQVPILLFGGMLILMLFRQGRKEKQEKQKLLDSLQKNDKVLTVGGIYGTIVAINENGDELTLKIDDNVKVRVTRTAILRKVVPTDAAKTGEA